MNTEPPKKLDLEEPDVDWAAAMRVDVFLDGEKQTGCRAYDCDAGTLRRIIEPACYDPIRKTLNEETVHGVVTVEWQE